MFLVKNSFNVVNSSSSSPTIVIRINIRQLMQFLYILKSMIQFMKDTITCHFASAVDRKDYSLEKGRIEMETAFRKQHNQRSLASLNAIFFDLDNTLVETRKADNQTCRKLAEELTREYGIPEDASAKITTAYLKQFRKCPDNATLTLDAWRIILWNKALGDKYSFLAKRIYERWLYLRYHYMALTPNTISMLRQLRKKYLLGLITNGPSNAQWEKIRKLLLEQYFDVILVSADLPWEKPEVEIFQKACHFLHVKPEECIMVGDKLETDILGGIEAGLRGTVWIPIADKPRLSGDDPKPDFTIRHVTELVRILDRGPNAPELEDCSSNASDGS